METPKEEAQDEKQPTNSLPPTYFEDLYQSNPDPWDFETSPYEAGKYATTLQALPRSSYRAALEIGCSIGVLTERLAPRCQALLSLDVSPSALARAKERCQHLPQVRFELRQVPEQFPDGNFDLIILSEVGYYLSKADLLTTQDLLIEHLEPGGQLLLVHWTPFVASYPLTGDEVHETFLASSLDSIAKRPLLRHLGGQRYEKYRLDLFERQ